MNDTSDYKTDWELYTPHTVEEIFKEVENSYEEIAYLNAQIKALDEIADTLDFTVPSNAGTIYKDDIYRYESARKSYGAVLLKQHTRLLEWKARATDMINTLEEPYRHYMQLLIIDHASQEDVAAQLGVKKDTVSRMCRKAIKQIKAKIGEV